MLWNMPIHASIFTSGVISLQVGPNTTRTKSSATANNPPMIGKVTSAMHPIAFRYAARSRGRSSCRCASVGRRTRTNTLLTCCSGYSISWIAIE